VSAEVVWASDYDASRALPLEVFRARPTGRRPRGRPRTLWRDNIDHLAWERHGISQEELESVAGEKESWGALPYKRKTMDGWMEVLTIVNFMPKLILLSLLFHLCTPNSDIDQDQAQDDITLQSVTARLIV